MRKLALLAWAILLAAAAHSQELNLGVGLTTLLSSSSSSASQSFLPPAERGGAYVSGSAEYILKNRLGFNAEITFRAKQGLYNGYQHYRPVLYDANFVYAPRLGERTTGELLAGVGGERVLFYNRFTACPSGFASGCLNYVSSDHFVVHVGGGLQYLFWHNFFIRPEAHLYIIPNNVEFNSNYVGRLGASIGYVFRR